MPAPEVGASEGDLLLIGSGSLATATVVALAEGRLRVRHVYVLARNASRLAEICALGTVAAAQARNGCAFRAVPWARASMPGPLGMPGGYPVALEDGRISLRLPPGVDVDMARAWNLESLAAEGIARIGTDGVEYTPGAAAALAATAGIGSFASGFRAGELDLAVQALLGARARLRAKRPAPV
jgi:hypothetical protein